MAIIQDRLSSTAEIAEYTPPEGDVRLSLLHDLEAGPIAITDTSAGMNYQKWVLSYEEPNIILTPQVVGSPSTIISVFGCTQISFCFDQNARPSIVYLTDTSCFLYWYDSTISNYTTTEFPGLASAILSLDDKRQIQISANDILFWYTKETSPGVFELYHRRQRDRFDTEFLMRENPAEQMPVPQYLWKAGMHKELRGQIALLSGGPGGTTPPVIPPGPVIPQANLDFELGDVYWQKTGDFAINTSDPYNGSWSAILNTIPANGSSLENAVYTTIAAGQMILLSYYIKGSIATTIKVGINFYNENKSFIAYKVQSINVTTNWTLESAEIIAPSNAVYARIRVESFSTDGIVSIDEFVFDANLYVVELATNEYFQVELDSLEYFRAEP